MANYLGRNPAVGTQRMLDSLESQFNGVLTTFDLRYGWVPTYPTLSSSLIVSLGGVLQEPGVAYYVSSDSIVFSEPPLAGAQCWILLYSQYGTGVGAAQQGTLGAETLVLTGQLQGPSIFVIDPATVGDDTGLVRIKGDLEVLGATTNINSTTLVIEDKNIILGDTSSPTNASADGGGITLKGGSDKTLTWVDGTDAWTSSERFSVPLGTAGAPSLTFTGDPNTGIYSPGADQLAISTNGTGRLFVDASGRLGLGTSAPESLLTVSQSGGPQLTLRNSNAASNGVADGTTLAIIGFAGTDFAPLGEQSVAASIRGVGEAAWTSTASSHKAGLAFLTQADSSIGKLERMRITNAGNVGIGTTSPGTRLCTYDAAAGNSSQFRVGFSDSFAWDISRDNGSTGDLTFKNSSGGAFTERARIDSSGRLLVGTFIYDGNARAVFTGNTSDNATGAVDIRRNTTRPTAADVQIGALRFITNDSTSSNYSYASIDVFTDGASSSNTDIPGRLVFSTTADGASSPTERMRISNAGTTTLTSAASTAPFIANISASEVARIDSSGRLLVGTSTARSNYYSSVTPGGIQTESGAQSLFQNSNNAIGSALYLGKSRGTTANSNTVVQADDQLGTVIFFGADGTNIWPGAQIGAAVDGTPGTNDMPGRLVFSTTADGASSPTERLRIDSAGQIEAGSLGTAAAPVWSFLNDTNTGIYSPGADQLAISTGGSGRLFVDASGNVGIGTTNPGYKLQVVGSFAATIKSFVIPHPTREGYRLRYGSLEGPENGVYVRGRSTNSVIELPEYWVKLVDEDSITVSLTPIGRSQSLWVKEIKDNKVYVESDSTDINYFYTVFAERIDVDKLEVETEVG
jgi:hypothetical protein